MLIWQGVGFIVPGLTFVIFLLTSIFVNLLFNNDDYFATHRWPRLVGFWVTGLLIWYVARGLQRKGTRVLIDKETGEEVTLRPRHSFFFIDLQYWTYILLILGVVFLFVNG